MAMMLCCSLNMTLGLIVPSQILLIIIKPVCAEVSSESANTREQQWLSVKD